MIPTGKHMPMKELETLEKHLLLSSEFYCHIEVLLTLILQYYNELELLVFNATLKIISVISLWSVLFVTG